MRNHGTDRFNTQAARPQISRYARPSEPSCIAMIQSQIGGYARPCEPARPITERDGIERPPVTPIADYARLPMESNVPGRAVQNCRFWAASAVTQAASGPWESKEIALGTTPDPAGTQPLQIQRPAEARL